MAGRIIIHVDMDAFYASVEIRDDPSLKGKPVIVGARPDERGVVATCSYEARAFGVRSGMNVKEAYSLCPDGVFIHPDHDKYVKVSKQLHGIWDPYASASQPMALDETYLDITDTAGGDFDKGREIAHLIKKRTFEELGLTCSVGLSYCMAAAKTASEEMKPDGYFEIETREEYVALMSERDIRELYSVGPRTEAKLRDMGIDRVCELLDHRRELEAWGQHGRFLLGLAEGIDDREVTPYNPEDAKSMSREMTFQNDVSDYMLLMDVLLLMSMSISDRASKYGLRGTGVFLRIRYPDRRTVTKARNNLRIDGPMDIARAAWSMLDESGRGPVRRIGVSMSTEQSSGSRQLTLDGDRSHDGDAELDHHLERMHRRYRFDFGKHRYWVLKHDSLRGVAEHMRIQCQKRIRR